MIRISDIVAPKLLINFNSKKLHQIDKGGRSSFKSSKNEVKIALFMLNDSKCDVVIVRQDQVDHRDTTFLGLIQGFARQGVILKPGVHYPRGKTSSLWIKCPGGGEISFKQMKEVEKVKGVRPSKPGNEIKIILFFEITQFKSAFEIKSVLSSYVRGNKDYFIALYEFNPAPKISHWTYDWLKEMGQRKDTIIEHTNYIDHDPVLLANWLGKIALQEIEAEKLLNYENYKHIYLGETANLTGSIYKKFDYNRHVEDMYTGVKYVKMNIGVDYGEVDATVFTLGAFKRGFTGLDIPLTYYHKNGVSIGDYGPFDYAERFFEFVNKCYSIYGIIMTAYIDTGGSKAFYGVLKRMQLEKHNFKVIIEPVKKFKKRSYQVAKDVKLIEERIIVTIDMFITDYIKINTVNKELIAAIVGAERNDKGERRDDSTVNVCSLDSFEYTWLAEMDNIMQIINISKIRKLHQMKGK